jgi:hypothetical protein
MPPRRTRYDCDEDEDRDGFDPLSRSWLFDQPSGPECEPARVRGLAPSSALMSHASRGSLLFSGKHQFGSFPLVPGLLTWRVNRLVGWDEIHAFRLLVR